MSSLSLVSEQAATPRMAPEMATGAVTLNVRDLARVSDFYQEILGLVVQDQVPGRVVLGAEGGVPLVTLVETPEAAIPPRRAAGLFHMAILLPTRADLGRWVGYMAATRTPVQGAADHLVSEAIYLSDPEGNGIEVYRDRPRHEWPHENGKLKMANAPVDFDGLLAEADSEGAAWSKAPAGTRMGHIHLNVNDLTPTLSFYDGGLGLDLMATMPQALFVSAGGYHHHIGLNTWAAHAGPRREPGNLGLSLATLELPDGEALAALTDSLAAGGIAFERPSDDLALVRDPSGNRLLFAAGRQASSDQLALSEI
ncbi:Catechol-2,3-dioxygenase [Hartmannibacter diazotrophicus]|uniref:Catechol-2,3-dioxygenase n=1 Tax=Hartmannibacter diazotrophicus TaxID=1482074 RepID=A0A2C9DA21_9HYPH|nr:VOC family protein [Hartmannibacter diazotrophicus]SON56591.1 Catechol-2,3-dioxygenase [Hartmannibacter diazotrophicus]